MSIPFDHTQGANLHIKYSVYKDCYTEGPNKEIQYIIVYINDRCELRYAITRHGYGLVSDTLIRSNVLSATLHPTENGDILTIEDLDHLVSVEHMEGFKTIKVLYGPSSLQ